MAQRGHALRYDLGDVARLAADLRRFARHAVPYATRNGLNSAAFEGRKLWVAEQERAFVLRNKFTTRAVRVDKSRVVPRLSGMRAVLGSVAPWMERQEKGGAVRGRGGRSKPIPTNVAAGQGQGVRPRTRAVRRPNRLTAIHLFRRRRGGKGRRQRNAIEIERAVRAGRRFALLDLGQRRGIFRISGRKRLKVRMVWDLSRRSVHLRPRPTLQRTLDELAPRLPTIHVEALLEQLRRNRVLGY